MNKQKEENSDQVTRIYDLIVIGSGAGNIVVDAALAAGQKVALIEKTAWGGTCLNHGCIPTKMLVGPADRIREAQNNSRLGLVGDPPQADWSVIRSRCIQAVERGRKGTVDYYHEQPNCDLILGRASFSGPHTLFVQATVADLPTGEVGKVILPPAEGLTVTAPKIVLACGGRTRIPDLPGLDQIPYFTSDRFFDQEMPADFPRSVALIGGADIGCEFAHIFSSFGADVTLVQRNVRLVPKQDEAVSQTLLDHFEAVGIKVLLRQNTQKVEPTEDGRIKLFSRDKETGEQHVTTADMLFISAGIEAVTGDLNLAAADVQTDKRGWIQTDKYLRTSAPGIYALGDINGRQQLRHKANYEAEILAYNLFQKKADQGPRQARYDCVPSATFTYPQIGRVGLTEKEAREQGLKVQVAIHHYSEIAKGWSLGIDPGDEDKGFAKLIVESESQKILGLHVVGPEASILVQGVAWLMHAGEQPGGTDFIDPRTVAALTRPMTIHPTLSELVGWAPQHLK